MALGFFCFGLVSPNSTRLMELAWFLAKVRYNLQKVCCVYLPHICKAHMIAVSNPNMSNVCAEERKKTWAHTEEENK